MTRLREMMTNGTTEEGSTGTSGQRIMDPYYVSSIVLVEGYR